MFCGETFSLQQDNVTGVNIRVNPLWQHSRRLSFNVVCRGTLLSCFTYLPSLYDVSNITEELSGIGRAPAGCRWRALLGWMKSPVRPHRSWHAAPRRIGPPHGRDRGYGLKGVDHFTLVRKTFRYILILLRWKFVRSAERPPPARAWAAWGLLLFWCSLFLFMFMSEEKAITERVDDEIIFINAA